MTYCRLKIPVYIVRMWAEQGRNKLLYLQNKYRTYMWIYRTELWKWLTQDKPKKSQSVDYASVWVRGRKKSSIFFCVAVVACLIWSQAPVAAVTGNLIGTVSGLWSDDLLSFEGQSTIGIGYSWATGTTYSGQSPARSGRCLQPGVMSWEEGVKGCHLHPHCQCPQTGHVPCPWHDAWVAGNRENSLLSLTFSVNNPEKKCNFDLYCPLYKGENL